MKRSVKSKRVSWASGVNLCQVVPFLSEDCPSKVGSAIRNKFPSVEPLSAFSNSMSKTLSCFGDKQFRNQLQQSVSNISCVSWMCPPKYAMSCDWHVVTGEESQEARIQKLRELNVLEAVYPRPSAVPSSPTVSLDVQQEYYDDILTPEISLIPIEEMENNPDAEPMIPNIHHPSNFGTSEVPKQQVPSSAGRDADILAAASAAFATLLKSSEKGSKIDTNLLIKLFNDPKSIEDLMNGGRSPAVGNESHPQTLQVPCSSGPDVPPPTSAAHVQSTQGLLRPSLSPSPQPVPVPLSSPTASVAFPFTNGPSPQSTQPFSHSGLVTPCPPHMSSGQLLGPLPGLDMISQPSDHYSMSSRPPQPIVQLPSKERCSPSSVIPSLGRPSPQPVSFEKVTRPPLPYNSFGCPMSNGIGKVNAQPGVPRDINYIKNLIRQHGGEKQDNVGWNLTTNGLNQNNLQNPKLGHYLTEGRLNFKNRQPCIFFNSPEGCRSGQNCPFQHDMGSNLTGDPVMGRIAKRAKVGEIWL